MRRANTLPLILGLLLSAPASPAGGTGEPTAAAGDAPPAVSSTEPPRGEQWHDYIDQVRAQRRAQIEQLRAESRDESERARQKHRESLEEQSRLQREQLDRRREPQFPIGAPPPVDWSNPWYYRGW